MREAIQRKLRNVEEQKADTEQQRDMHKNQITALEKGNSNTQQNATSFMHTCQE